MKLLNQPTTRVTSKTCVISWISGCGRLKLPNYVLTSLH